jgi:amino acid adenylation domain-containing protein
MVSRDSWPITTVRTNLSSDPPFRDLLDEIRRIWRCRFEGSPDGVAPMVTPPVPCDCVDEGGRNPPPEERHLADDRSRNEQSGITVHIVDRPDYVAVTVDYDPSLFGAAQITETQRQYVHLLSQVAAAPEERITRLSLVTDHARGLLAEPDGAARLSLARRCARHLPAARSGAPTSVAIVGSRCVTYQELHQNSDRLAAKLTCAGIREGDIVAIYAQRCAALVCAVLGTMKSGAAFLILDPAYPVPRLKQYLDIAQPRAWIDVSAVECIDSELVQSVLSIPFKCRVSDSEIVMRPAETVRNVRNVRPVLEARSRACVSFTSGSTGTPKAVVGGHGSLSHFTDWQKQTFGFSKVDRFSMLSGLSHDPLQRDILTPLQLGAAICIPAPEESSTPARLAEWLCATEVTVVHLTPGVLRLLTTQTAVRQLPSLRLAFVAGDVLTRSDVMSLRRLAPNVTCINFYGATETQRAVGYSVVADNDDRMADLGTPLPVGVGIRDVQLLVLNRMAQLAGIGEVGEICVRSPHLALRYLNDPELTRERFTLNPFTSDPADRLYRTGDLGRYLITGELEFIGRADQQIKIAGYRVELS